MATRPVDQLSSPGVRGRDAVRGTKPSWRYTFKRAIAEFIDDQCTDLAAGLTYYAVLALFPALIALIGLLGVLGSGNSDQALAVVFDVLGRLLPADTFATVKDLIAGLGQTGGSGWGLVLGLLGSMWSASAYVMAFSRAMNRIYEVPEGRPIWKLRPANLLVTMVALVLAALVLVILVVSGPVAEAISRAVGLGDAGLQIWGYAKWPILLVSVIFLVALLYWATPNVRQQRFRWLSVGAAVAIVTWLVASLGFGFYVSNFGSYNKTYGAMAGLILLLLWLWITNIALLLGGQIDAELERVRQLRAGIEAEETLRLPLRDDRGSEKAAAKREEVVAEAKLLRLRRRRD